MLYIIIISFIINIKCNKSQTFSYDNKNVSFHGVYRIDTFIRDYSLTYESKHFILSKKKYLNNQFRIYSSEYKPHYYIELKSKKRKIGVMNNNLFLYKRNITNINVSKFLWDIIEVNQNQYLIQNQYNKKYLLKNNRKIKFFKNYYNLTEYQDLFKFHFFKLYEEPDYKQEYLEIIDKEPIDIVIKYIDLTDKTLNRTGIKQIKKDMDNEELRYSVRSTFQYIPWIRKIFIIMPNEKVKYFKPVNEIKEKIIYIKDKDLLGFDSANIQSFLFNFYKLDNFGVSNNFIYMDDDYFIGQVLNKSNFFYYEEKEKEVKPCIINYFIYELNKRKSMNNYNFLFRIKDLIQPHSFLSWKLSLKSTEKFFLDNYNSSHLIYTESTHNAIPMNIMDLKEIFKEIQKYEYINETINNIHRSVLRINCQYFYSLYNLNIKHRKVHSIFYKYITFYEIESDKLYYPLFVINTDLKQTLSPTIIQKGKEIIKKRFPYPTKYEIINEDEGNNKTNYEEENIINIINDKNLSDFNKNERYKFLQKKHTVYVILIIFILLLIILFCLYKVQKKKIISQYVKIYNSEK